MRIGDLRGVVEAGLCDTATSITVRRPTLSLSRDPDQHGGEEGVHIRAHVPLEPWGARSGSCSSRANAWKGA